MKSIDKKVSQGEPTLLVMAAGMGSRYGGAKQVDRITDAGEIILDFSLYDAMMAGFEKVVFVIRKEHREIFDEIIGERAGKLLDVQYAYQELDDIPAGFEVPKGRVKPWGTGHAILAARDLIDGPFAVINADDYYGAESFEKVYEYLKNNPARKGEKYPFCMAGYKLENTITENGSVARGVCEIDKEWCLTGITERTKIMRRPEGIAFTEDEKSWEVLPEGTVVSMNFWGFPAEMMAELNARLPEFLEANLGVNSGANPNANPEKCEYQLPVVVDRLISEGKAEVKVLRSNDRWCGVTYKEDKEDVKNTLQSRKDKGEYPEILWKARSIDA